MMAYLNCSANPTHRMKIKFPGKASSAADCKHLGCQLAELGLKRLILGLVQATCHALTAAPGCRC